MQRIGAALNNLVPDFTSLGIAAAVVDTGVDRRHPDLNVVGGKSMVTGDASGDPYTDGFGHGTHVAGILGAKNNGQGIVGTAPGIPIYSLKVLSSDGTGTTADLLRAYEWLYYNARALGIRVVNLSLTGGGGETDPQCEWTSSLAKQGITLVSAAGNSNVNLMTEAPGACAKTLVVSAHCGCSSSCCVQMRRITLTLPSCTDHLPVSSLQKLRPAKPPGHGLHRQGRQQRQRRGLLVLQLPAQRPHHRRAPEAHCGCTGGGHREHLPH